MLDDEAALLAASKAAYQSHSSSTKTENRGHTSFTDDNDMITFEAEDAQLQDDTPTSAKPSKQKLNAKQLRKKRAVQSVDADASLKALEVKSAPVRRSYSKKEIQEHRAKSAGPGWFDMPAFPGAKFSGTGKDTRTETGKASFTGGDARAATEKEMRRQVTAIRLRNALDPKRFYRGSGGTGAEKGMPAFAQLGKIVGGGLEPSSVLTRKQRADTVVGELVRDAESVSYSKRKFGELQQKRMAPNQKRSKTQGKQRRRP